MSILVLGLALLGVFVGLHFAPSYRTSKSYRRAIQGWGLAIVGLICVVTFFVLDTLIGLMLESGYPAQPYTAWTFHWYYLIAFAVLATTLGVVLVYRRIVKRWV